jgi:hypothetical protein
VRQQPMLLAPIVKRLEANAAGGGGLRPRSHAWGIGLVIQPGRRIREPQRRGPRGSLAAPRDAARREGHRPQVEFARTAHRSSGRAPGLPPTAAQRGARRKSFYAWTAGLATCSERSSAADLKSDGHQFRCWTEVRGEIQPRPKEVALSG